MTRRRFFLSSILILAGLATPAEAGFVAMQSYSQAAAPARPTSGGIVPSRRYPGADARQLFPPDSRLPGPSVWAEVDFLHRRISRARDAGLITRREARRLHREADAIAYQGVVYATHGFSDSERTELSNRARIVSDAVALPRRPD